MILYDPESHQPGKPAALVESRAGQKRGERSTDSSNSAEEEEEEKEEEEGVVASRAHPPKSTRTSSLEIGCKQGCECQHMIDISSKPIHTDCGHRGRFICNDHSISCCTKSKHQDPGLYISDSRCEAYFPGQSHFCYLLDTPRSAISPLALSWTEHSHEKLESALSGVLDR